MYELEPRRESRLASRDARQVDRIRSRNHVRETIAYEETDFVVTKIQCDTLATATGMKDVTGIGQILNALELHSPASSGRLNLIADHHAMGVTDALEELRHRLRRL
jgi:hypothetical protein